MMWIVVILMLAISPLYGHCGLRRVGSEIVDPITQASIRYSSGSQSWQTSTDGSSYTDIDGGSGGNNFDYRIDANTERIVQNTWSTQINGARSVSTYPDWIVDEYQDASGVDGVNTNAQLYSGNYYSGQSATYGDGRDGEAVITYDACTYTSTIASGRTAPDMVAYRVVDYNSAWLKTQYTIPANTITAGDEVLVICLQGWNDGSNTNSVLYTQVGNYEFGTVSSIGTTGMVLSQSLEKEYIDSSVKGTDQDTDTEFKIVVQRVPNYSRVQIATGARLGSKTTANGTGWNGLGTTNDYNDVRTGVVAFRCAGSLTVTGSIDCSSAGYRPAYGVNFIGEGIAFTNQWLGAGAFSASFLDAAIESGGIAGGSHASTGGFGTANVNGATLIKGDDKLTQMHFGGGSGYNSASFRNSGGIIYISASNTVLSSADSINCTAGVGGGAGGSIYLQTKTLDAVAASINVLGDSFYESSGGRCRVEVDNVTGVALSSAVTGVNNNLGQTDPEDDGSLSEGTTQQDDYTLQSESFTFSINVSEGTMMYMVDEFTSGTVSPFVSFDGGTSFTQVSASAVGELYNNDVYKGTFTLPSVGSTCVYKIEGTNTTARIEGAAVFGKE